MIKWLFEYFTAIDEFEDLWNIWYKVCGYLENEMGWSYLASSVVSLLITLGRIFLLPAIVVSIGIWLWKKFKNA